MANKNKGIIIHSLYDWCIENNRQDILLRWDESLNKLNPKEIGAHSRILCYLKCERGIHESQPFTASALSHRPNSKHVCDLCYSFGQWCIDVNRLDILQRFDILKNGTDAFSIYKTNKDSFYFKCDIDSTHISTKHSIQIMDENTVITCCECTSFYKWGIETLGNDFIEKFWDKKLNDGIDPRAIQKRSNKTIYMICQEKLHHPSYKTTANIFSLGVRCPCCNGKQTHPLDSFGNFHVSNTDPNFVSKYWSSKNTKSPFEYSVSSGMKAWFICQEKSYHNDYQTSCSDFTRGARCPSCNTTHVHILDSLGTLFPASIDKWSDKNELTPFDYFPKSTTKVFWKCESGNHEDYLRSPLEEIKSGFMCPSCSALIQRSILQEKVNDYITNKYGFTILHERKCSLVPNNPKIKNGRGDMPYDNEVYINSSRLLIESHGIQHSEVCGLHLMAAKHNGTTPEYEFHKQQVHDRYKKLVAFIKGYEYLEISYKDLKDELYKTIIDNKIASITKLIKNQPKIE